MSILPYLYNLTNCGASNMMGVASMLPNMFSPATQMVFSGTDSKFNLANWNIFGAYNSFGCYNALGTCGDASYETGSMVGMLALFGGTKLLGSTIKAISDGIKSKKAAEEKEAARPGELRNEIENYNSEINSKLSELPGSVTENNYEDAKPSQELQNAVTNANAEFEKVENSISGLESSETTAKNNYLNVVKQLAGTDLTEDQRKALQSQKTALKEIYDDASKELEEAKNSIAKPNGELYKAKAEAENNLKTENERIAGLISEIRDLIAKRNAAQQELQVYEDREAAKKQAEQDKAAKRAYENADGTAISRLFGDEIEDKNGLHLPEADKSGRLDINNVTIQRILCKYKSGTNEEKTTIKNWLIKYQDKLPAKYKNIVQNIIDGTDYYTKKNNQQV